jgi:putative phosphoesterase
MTGDPVIGGLRPCFTVGVVSDTHGHLYAEVKKALQGVDHIIHAGDIGSPQVLAELSTVAPVTAVRGNCDYDQWAQKLPLHATLELGGARITVSHVGRQSREWVGAAAGADDAAAVDAVVFGHSHIALLEWRMGVLYLNPGSAGPRRFDRPRSLARLTVRPATAGLSTVRPILDAEIVTVE